jgi:ferritin-like metal-binding protein YciE
LRPVVWNSCTSRNKIPWNGALLTPLSNIMPHVETTAAGCRRLGNFERHCKSGAAAMEISNFKDMYLAELQELVSVERQLADALLRMAGAATHRVLKDLLVHHRAQTETHEQRLLTILGKHGADPAAHTDQAMQALINETKKMVAMLTEDDLRDAGLVASVQKLEHYEIAAYGTAAALAGQLDLRDEQKMLHLTLEEERQTDARLTQLAKREVNPDALAA